MKKSLVAICSLAVLSVVGCSGGSTSSEDDAKVKDVMSHGLSAPGGGGKAPAGAPGAATPAGPKGQMGGAPGGAPAGPAGAPPAGPPPSGNP